MPLTLLCIRFVSSLPQAPSFGLSSSHWDIPGAFYAYWTSFSSSRDFAEADQWSPKDLASNQQSPPVDAAAAPAVAVAAPAAAIVAVAAAVAAVAAAAADSQLLTPLLLVLLSLLL